jgi:hypothetical protein
LGYPDLGFLIEQNPLGIKAEKRRLINPEKRICQ